MLNTCATVSSSMSTNASRPMTPALFTPVSRPLNASTVRWTAPRPRPSASHHTRWGTPGPEAPQPCSAGRPRRRPGVRPSLSRPRRPRRWPIDVRTPRRIGVARGGQPVAQPRASSALRRVLTKVHLVNRKEAIVEQTTVPQRADDAGTVAAKRRYVVRSRPNPVPCISLGSQSIIAAYEIS